MPDTKINLGNKLNRIVTIAKGAMFDQGELSQLTYNALDIAAHTIQGMQQDEIDISYPVGHTPERTPVISSRKYRKDELLQRYQFLAFHQLSVNALVQLVTIIESMLGDITREVVVRYPQKLGAKKQSLFKQF